jgi:hypothetical protein
MAVRSDVYVNWPVYPREIVVPSPSTEITIQDLVDTCRELEQELDNLDKPKLIDAAGKEFLGGTNYVGITATLQGAVILFEAKAGPDWILCIISGGNVVAVDTTKDPDDPDYYIDPRKPSAYTSVDRTASASATLQEQEALQFSSFNGGVSIDITSSNTGTTYPIGTEQAPVNNLSDAVSIANDRGFKTFYIIGDITIDDSEDFSDMIFIGESMTKSTITVLPIATIDRAEFYECHLTGTLDGEALAKSCRLDDINYISGIVQQCVLEEGTILLGGSQTAHFLDCWSGVPGTSTPIIDLGGSGQALALRNYNGGITLKNKSGSESVSIDMNSGQVILDTDVTNGDIVIRGIGKLTDNSVGANVISEDFMNPDNIADHVWDHAIAFKLMGLNQENFHMDQQVYQDYNGAKLLTSARIRTYEDSSLTQLIATYQVTATWSNGQCTDYQMVIV